MRAVLARPAPLGTRRVPSSNFRRRPRPLPTVRPCRCAPKFNPQNVHDSSITPALELDALSCVEAQMEALRSPHSPRTNHGIEVMYAFCEGSGSMERSRYFGYSKDLYHFDHFLGGFQNEFPELLGYDAYRLVGDAGRNEQGEATVDVVVTGSRGASSFEETFTFCLVERDFGRKKGCLMTSRIIRRSSS